MELINFLIRHQREVLLLTLQHLELVAMAVAVSAIVGIPTGILLTRRPGLSKPVLALANILQTIPSLALFGFLIPILGSYGIGRLPAVIALFLYSLLPIIRNTFTGIQGVDRSVREAAHGMGMTNWQLLTQVELPLALNVIIAGLRVATVISVGTATIAAAIGAGGLGTYIFRGLRMNDNLLILTGAIPAALMALAADFSLGFLEKALAPEGRFPRGGWKKWGVATAMMILLLGTGIVLSGRNPSAQKSRVAIGSKDFTEQVILGELLAQLVESQPGFEVVRRFELGGDLCHRAMLSGEIDAYVEYTGTALMAILKLPPKPDAGEVYRLVKSEYARQFDIEWLEPLGFNNTFAILVRQDDADRLKLKTISDALPHARSWRAGFGQDFMSRQDGYPGFARAYGLSFKDPPKEMDLALTYRALASAQVDLIAGNSTDGLISQLNLAALEDDLHYFPPYQAAPLARRDMLEAHPELRRSIARLTGRIPEEEIRRMNYQVDGEKREIKSIVRGFLVRNHLVTGP
ncbi:MAG: ABC transporter permease subunit [Acidobacteria bacterium]|nr:ABC transporter permease subunit [Acidobacteriota bacterium]